MSVRNPLARRPLRLSLLCRALMRAALLSPAIVMAQVLPGGGKTEVYNAPNGVPIVNIETANGAGLSHNRYLQFNVDGRGLVLNNGNYTQMTRESQLAGQVMANPNLQAEAALILNEVIAPNRSNLAGYMEVLGRNADVVVANPNGITCDGCGFINTPRVTLTTGTPGLAADGSLAGLAVGRGDVLVYGKGLDGRSTDILDIVARTVRLDGQINGHDVQLTAGANQYDYASRSATALVPGTAAPGYAIDSSVLGGMYANRIRLVATEAGVGVRMLGEAAATGDDFTLSAAGQVQLQGRVSAQRDLRLDYTGDAGGGAAALELSGSAALTAGRDIALSAAAAGIALTDSPIKAGGDLTLTSATLSDASASAASRHAAGDVTVDVAGAAQLDGTVWGAGGRLAATTGSLAVGGQGATVYSGGDTAAANRSLELTATQGDLSLAGAQLLSPADVRLTAQQGGITTGAAASVQAGRDLALAAGTELANAGRLLAGQDLAFRAADGAARLSNSGLMQAGNALGLGAAGPSVDVVNQASGALLGDRVAFTGGALDNHGTVQGTNGVTVSATGAVSNRADGKILSTAATKDVTLTAGSLDNAGVLQSAGDLSATTTGTLANSGTVLTQDGAGHLALQGANVSNTGTVQAANTATIKSSATTLANSATVQAQGALTLSAAKELVNSGAAAKILGAAGVTLTSTNAGFAVSNDGRIQAGGALALGQAGHGVTTLNNGSGAVLRGDTLGFTGGTLDNRGTVQGTNGVSVTATGAVSNRTGARILSTAATKDVAIGAASLDNEGVLQSAGDLSVSTTGALANSGTILAQDEAGHLSLQGASLVNSGTVQAANTATLASTAATLTNTATVQAAQALMLSAATALNNSGAAAKILGAAGVTLTSANAGFAVSNDGRIQAGGALALGQAGHGVAALNNNGGAVLLGDTLGFTGDALDNRGTVQGTNGVSVTATGAVNNRTGARILSTAATKDVTIGAASLDNEGVLQSAGDLSVSTTGALANSGMILAQDEAGHLSLQGASLANSGTVQAANTATLASTAATLTNTATVQAAQALMLSAATALNNSGAAAKILGAAGVTLTSANAGFTLSNDGRIQAGGALVLGDAAHLVSTLDNATGAVLMGETLAFTGGSLVNRGRVQSASQASVIGSTLENKGSSAVIVLGLDGTASTVTLSGKLSNEGALHGGGNLAVQASGIDNSSTGGISSLADLSLTATGSGIDNAGALYAGNKLGATATGQTITNQGTGTMDGRDIAVSAGSFTNYNTVVATRDIAIDTTNAFSNRPVGGMPSVIDDAPVLKETNTLYSSGAYNCNIFGTHCDYDWLISQVFLVTQSLSGPAPTQKGQIIAGNAITLKYGASGENLASLISAPTVNISGTGSFTNRDLHLEQHTYEIRVRRELRQYTFKDDTDTYRYPLSGDTFYCANGTCFSGSTGSLATALGGSVEYETSRSVQQAFGAGIYASTLTYSGGTLKNMGSPYAASVKTSSAGGTGGSSLDSVSGTTGSTAAGLGNAGAADGVGAAGATPVPSANGISFTGLNLALPTNPNGYFVVAKNPSSKYLVETNPLFGVGANFVGSDYMAHRLGFNPDVVGKRLGDANYEARLIREQLVAQTGRNILVAQAGEAAQIQALMDNAVGQSAGLGLKFGQPLTQEQRAALKQDIVWMVEQVVAGQKVLVPVVYLAQSTRDAIEGQGATIAATDMKIDAKSLENTGGTISADKTLSVKTQGDLTNTSGTIRGGDVSLTSTGGSIVNQTRVGNGNEEASAVIGKTGGIRSTGNLALDAAKDITVRGADVKAGGDAALTAGGSVTFDTVKQRTIEAGQVSGKLLGVQDVKASSQTVTTQNIGSNLESGGNLKISSGKDTTFAGSSVKADGDLKVDAKGDLNILSRQDTVETTSTANRSGFGVGGGLWGTETTVKEEFDGKNFGSTIRAGGNADLKSGGTFTTQGSTVKVDGDASIQAGSVQVLDGQDKRTSKTTTTTTTVFSLSSDKKAEASTGESEDKKLSKGASAAASAGASDSTSIDFVKRSTTETSTYDSKSVGSLIEVGGNLKVQSRTDVTLQGSKVDAGGDLSVEAKDVNVRAGQDVSVTTTSTRSVSIGLSSDNQAKAGAEAGAAGELKKLSGEAGAKAAADASSETTVGVRIKKEESLDLSITNKAAGLSAGGKLAIDAKDKLDVKGSELASGGDMTLKARDMSFTEANDVQLSTSKSDTTSVGIFIDGKAGAHAQGEVSGGVQGMGVSASGEAKAGAEAGSGLAISNNQSSSTSGSTTAVTSSIKAGGSVSRTAEGRIADVGTQIEAGGDFRQSAATIESRAAANTTFSSSESDTHTGKIGGFGEANADIEGGAGVQGGLGMGGGSVGKNNGGSASANAMAGIKLQYSNEKESASSSSSTAVTSGIRAGGSISSSSSGKTSLEGTRLDAGKDVTLEAGSLDYSAAKSTTQSTSSSRQIDAEIKAGLTIGTEGKGVGGAIGGGYGSGDSSSSSSTAVTGGVSAGGNLTVKTGGDARFEGTDLSAGGKASIAAGSDVKFDAARNESSSSEKNISASGRVGVATETTGKAGSGSGAAGKSGSKKAFALEAEGGTDKRESSSNEAVTGSIRSGGNLSVSSGKSATFEGTELKAGGDASVTAKDDVSFNAAKSTTTEKSYDISGSAKLTNSGGHLSAEGGYQSSKESTSTAASVQSGGKLAVSGGRDVNLEGTGVSAGGKATLDAGRDLNVKAAENTSESFGAEGSLSLRGKKQQETPKAATAQTSAPGAGAATAAAGRTAAGKTPTRNQSRAIGGSLEMEKGSERTGASIQAGDGLEMKAGRNLGVEGGTLETTKGDVNLSAGGKVELSTADSQSIGGSVGASKQSNQGGRSSKGTGLNQLEFGIDKQKDGVDIRSQGNLNISSGGKTTLTATDAQVGGKATIEAGGGVEKKTAVGGAFDLSFKPKVDVDVQRTTIREGQAPD